jgi:hypothetical protein
LNLFPLSGQKKIFFKVIFLPELDDARRRLGRLKKH